MTFVLHPNLAQKAFIVNLPLCSVLLEDEKFYPWLILVPRLSKVSRIIDLSFLDQQQLIKELDFVQKVVWKEFNPSQLNVAAIGNKTPQLHVHVIARYESDPAWPGTVWDHSVRSKYEEEEKSSIVYRLRALFKKPIEHSD